MKNKRIKTIKTQIILIPTSLVRMSLLDELEDLIRKKTLDEVKQFINSWPPQPHWVGKLIVKQMLQFLSQSKK